jgi:hypothetical protein
LLKPVQSILKSSVFFDQLNVLFGQVFFVLSQEIDFTALGLFLIETRIGSHIVARGLLVVEPEFLLNQLFFLFGELIVSQKFIVSGSFFSDQLNLFSELFDFQLHTFPTVFIVQGMSFSVIIF